MSLRQMPRVFKIDHKNPGCTAKPVVTGDRRTDRSPRMVLTLIAATARKCMREPVHCRSIAWSFSTSLTIDGSRIARNRMRAVFKSFAIMQRFTI